MESQAVSMLAEFIRYNNWANQQILTACQQLTDDQLAATLPGGYGPIRDTLEHLIRAEAGYVGRLTGQRPLPSFKWEDRPDVPQMTEYAAQVGTALVDATQRISPTDLISQEWEGKRQQFQAGAIFIQIINHGIEHRTNITTILTQGPFPPPEVDGWSYLLAQPERFALTEE